VVMHYLMICTVASSLPAYFSWNLIWDWEGGSEGSWARHRDVEGRLEDVWLLILILVDGCGGISMCLNGIRICGCRSVLILYLSCCYWLYW
jgi:hypothetical protein